MARVLFVWEQGSGYGHINRILPVGLALRERGHEVTFALRDVSRAEGFFGSRGLRYLQAPMWLPRAVNVPPTLSYAGILAHAGWLDGNGLTGLMRAWRELYALTGADVVVCDHSPTAMLAARGLPLAVAQIGNGFEIPPPTVPLPSLAWWQPAPAQVLLEREEAILRHANAALANLGAPPLPTLAALFDGVATFVAAYEETDQYPGREATTEYWGAIAQPSQGVPAVWPAGEGPKVFVYVRPEYRDFERLLGALGALRVPTLVHAPGVGDAAMTRFGKPTLAFSARPVSMNEVVAGAALVIGHSGIGTGTSALLGGVPLLLLPTHMEQMMSARRLEDFGAALAVAPADTGANYRRLVGRLLEEPRFRERARIFAARYHDYDLAAQLGRIATRLESLVAGG